MASKISLFVLFVCFSVLGQFCVGYPGKDKPKNNPRGENSGHGKDHERGQDRRCGVAAKQKKKGKTEYEDWPWAVIIGKPKEPIFQVMCGGTLISRRHVLTAAHCFVGVSSPATHVRVGEYDLSRTDDGHAENIPIKSFKAHEGFTFTYLQNDIAIVELENEIEYRRDVRHACMPNQYIGLDLTKLSSEVTIVGWGATAYGGDTVSVQKEAKVSIVSRASCLAVYDPTAKNFISDKQICAGTEKVDSCSGDSGGPMLSNQFGSYALVGITSFGVKCKDPTFPGVYTRVDQFLDWIQANMN